MSTFSADSGMSPSMVTEATSQQELARHKQSIDSLRKRLGDNTTKEQKLRESCEGFEAVFLQKMWEEMRKNVNKEGYLHSKDEDMYQSMFDVELSKKMTSAGGIGLSDMLYEQLSQQLSASGRSHFPTPRKALPIDAKISKPLAEIEKKEAKTDLTAKNLYSALDTDIEQNPDHNQTLEKTLNEIRAEVAGVKLPTSSLTDQVQQPSFDSLAQTQQQAPPLLVPKTIEKIEAKGSNAIASSWKANNTRVSAKPKPLPSHKGRLKQAVSKSPLGATTPSRFASNAGTSRGILPADALWPAEGKISSGFGWQDDGLGKRHWSAGISIEAKPGTPVAACMQGKVLFAGPAEGYENLVVLEHSSDYKTYYGNITNTSIKPGDVIQGGMNFAEIAENPSGSENKANSSLFFALKRGEMSLNPEVAIPRLVTASR